MDEGVHVWTRYDSLLTPRPRDPVGCRVPSAGFGARGDAVPLPLLLTKLPGSFPSLRVENLCGEVAWLPPPRR